MRTLARKVPMRTAPQGWGNGQAGNVGNLPHSEHWIPGRMISSWHVLKNAVPGYFRRKSFWLLLALLATGAGLFAFQEPFRVYQSLERYDITDLPNDWNEKTEWAFGRLMYPSSPTALFGARMNWRYGGTSWSEDYPRGDRHFLMALRRLTRVHARSVEQPINLEDGDDVFNWPWIYAGLPGDWALTDEMASRFRDYLLRGGFFMADDFWNVQEWQGFENGMKKVFPDRPIVDIDGADPIFHLAYDLDDRYQIPGDWMFRGSMTYRSKGTKDHWRGVYDDKGRLMVAICFNSDLGDAWEWADSPYYPEKYSALAIRIGVNYVLYSLTH